MLFPTALSSLLSICLCLVCHQYYHHQTLFLVPSMHGTMPNTTQESPCPPDVESPSDCSGEAKVNPAFTIWSLWWVHQRVWAWKGAVSTLRAFFTLQKHSGWFSFIANVKNIPPIFHSKGGSSFSPSPEAAAENLSNRASSVSRRTSGKEDSNSWEKEIGMFRVCSPAWTATAHTAAMASLVRLWRYWGRPGTVKV